MTRRRGRFAARRFLSPTLRVRARFREMIALHREHELAAARRRRRRPDGRRRAPYVIGVDCHGLVANPNPGHVVIARCTCPVNRQPFDAEQDRRDELAELSDLALARWSSRGRWEDA